MKLLSSHSRIGQDTTPATHGDIEIWGGRLSEKIDEAKEELKAELGGRLDKMENQQTALEQRQIRLEDRVNDMYLLLKSVAKKVLGK